MLTIWSMKLTAAKPPAHNDLLLVLPIYICLRFLRKGEKHENILAWVQMFTESTNLNQDSDRHHGKRSREKHKTVGMHHGATIYICTDWETKRRFLHLVLSINHPCKWTIIVVFCLLVLFWIRDTPHLVMSCNFYVKLSIVLSVILLFFSPSQTHEQGYR